MAQKVAERKKAKRKAKQKDRRERVVRSLQAEKAETYFLEGLWHEERGHQEKALRSLERAVRLDSGNEKYLHELGHLANLMGRKDLELLALLGLYEIQALDTQMIVPLCHLLINERSYERALQVLDESLPLFSRDGIRGKKTLLKSVQQMKDYCRVMIERGTKESQREPASSSTLQPKAHEPPGTASQTERQMKEEESHAPFSAPEVEMNVLADFSALLEALSKGKSSTYDQYQIALQAYVLRFKNLFESLVSLDGLQGVRSLWYQEETVRKVMKGFRGRALLADEVGLGKTIEALMILKEYIMRGMVQSALILVPASLVSQWKDELRVKFSLDFISTDDPDFQSGNSASWNRGFVLSSINVAKSRKNFSLVTGREWDMVIVDEAHHLKNRNTLNWKLVNGLKKRFILLLTATPVENNLVELYNLVTLLKPGQLRTMSEFKRDFMTRGDPTDPKNRSLLRDLLGQVMIRNTRAVAKIDIPPRYAETLKVEGSSEEKDLYERISNLVKRTNAEDGRSHRLLMKNLLEEAGSSPRAVSLTLSRLFHKGNLLPIYEKEIQAIDSMCLALKENSKNRVLLNLIHSSREKMIVFVKYLGTLDHISCFLQEQGVPFALFHGRLNSGVKEEQIRYFRDEANILVTTEIGGEGRNMQFCNRMVNYDLPWNPMKIEQRIGRIHRLGQEKEVFIYNLCASGSIEERILDILDRKINMFEMVIGEVDMILGRISEDHNFSDMIYDIWVDSATDGDLEKGFAQLAARLKRARTAYEKTKELDEKLFGENYEL
ncbi:MAG: SNF2-related protein [Pseudomonadota bacterium]